jgi:hypothetical protein
VPSQPWKTQLDTPGGLVIHKRYGSVNLYVGYDRIFFLDFFLGLLVASLLGIVIIHHMFWWLKSDFHPNIWRATAWIILQNIPISLDYIGFICGWYIVNVAYARYMIDTWLYSNYVYRWNTPILQMPKTGG